MANNEKYKQGAIGHMFNHYARATGDDVKRGNEEIDKTRTYLNYNLLTGETADGERRAETQEQRLKHRLSEVKHRNLKSYDDNLVCTWIVTLPQDVPAEKADEFFKHCYDFMCERYGGEKNVMSAWVHKDETRPHMHFCFMPIVTDYDKDGQFLRERLCAKERVSRFDLQTFHPQLQEYVEGKMQQHVSILNGATAGGNLTILELKMREALKDLAEVQVQKEGIINADPIIKDTLKMMDDVSEVYRKLDESLKAKKWFGDDDKAKMKALTSELDEIKSAAETASKTAEALKKALQSMGDIVGKSFEDVYAKLNEAEKEAKRRIKRTENKLQRREQRLDRKEQSIDSIVERRVNQKLSELDKTISAKQDKSAELDKEISEKQKQLTRMQTEQWVREDSLRTAELNRKLYADAMSRLREQAEQEQDLSTDLDR